jgi:hypothetical protein
LSARFPCGTPDAFVASLDHQLSELHERWVTAARFGEPLPLECLRNAGARLRRRYDALPFAEIEVHSARRLALRACLELPPGAAAPDLQNIRSPVGETYEWVRRIRTDVRAILTTRARTDAFRSA